MPKWTEPWKVIKTYEHKSRIVKLQSCIDSHLIRDVPLTQVQLIPKDLLDHLSKAIVIKASSDLRKDVVESNLSL